MVCRKYLSAYFTFMLSVFFVFVRTEKRRLFMLNLACRIQFESFLFDFLRSIFKLVLISYDKSEKGSFWPIRELVGSINLKLRLGLFNFSLLHFFCHLGPSPFFSFLNWCNKKVRFSFLLLKRCSNKGLLDGAMTTYQKIFRRKIENSPDQLFSCFPQLVYFRF